MSGVIGVSIGVAIGIILATIVYYIGWESGWNDCKKFTYEALGKLDDDGIVTVARGMAEKLKGGQDDKS